MPKFEENGLAAPNYSKVELVTKFFMTDEFHEMWFQKYSIEASGIFIKNINRKIDYYCCFCQSKYIFTPI